MQGSALKALSITGLHQYLNIDLDFQPSLNVIYGKNGKGKTTVLHIIANILEMDFARFTHLQFDSIKIESYAGNTLNIDKSSDGEISISFNEHLVGKRETEKNIPKLSPQEMELISHAFGGKPVYLPAYRSILERVRASGYENSNTSEYEAIKSNEMKSTKRLRSHLWHTNDSISSHVARKTVQCREWFGPFVPVIRYPGLAEVVETISDEFLEAQNESSQSERKMLSSMFIGVFRSLVSTQDTPNDWEVEPLLEQVQNLLTTDNYDNQLRPDTIAISLAEEIAQAKSFSSPNENAAQKRVLKLYADLLEQRNIEKKSAFDKIKSFESAVNLFLDGKKLIVSDHAKRHPLKWREFAHIETINGNSYPLSTLSSGERQILTMLFSATRMSAAETGLFLIDEPELSLHVDWQRIILTELNKQAPQRQIIACTHSPEVGADHDDAVQMFFPRVSPQLKGDMIVDESEFTDEI